jgi:hypothetical protein
MYQKIGILAVLASVLLSAALLVTPTLKVANAQGNETQGNQTKTIDVDKWITTLKENNPGLAALEDECKATDPTHGVCDVKDSIGKIIGMKDAKEAVKTLEALRLFHSLMDFKAAQEAQ